MVPRSGPPSLWTEGSGYAQTMPIDDQLAIVGRLALAAALGAAIGMAIGRELIEHEDPDQEGTENDR